jgi:shikimate dehydrogenase
MEHLDEIDETARAIGAVNTVLIDGDLLRGYNTDAEGFIAPLLSRYGSLKNARTGIFGAGGAARACLYALKKEGASTAIFARDPEKGKELGDEFGTDFFSIGDAATGSFDILVNATPVGMAGNLEDQAPFKLEETTQTKLVYDLVTSAEPTPLIRQARAAGIETITGVEMLVAQAVRQFEIWTNKIAPREAVQRAAEGYPTNV